MHYVLSEVRNLSKQLQRKDVSMPEAVSLLSRQDHISASKADGLGAEVTKMALPKKMFAVHNVELK